MTAFCSQHMRCHKKNLQIIVSFSQGTCGYIFQNDLTILQAEKNQRDMGNYPNFFLRIQASMLKPIFFAYILIFTMFN